MAGIGAFLKNVYVNATGQAVPLGANVRVRGYMLYNPGVPGSMILRSGGASGTIVYQVDTMGAANLRPFWAGEGYRFTDGIHVTLSPAGSTLSLDVDGLA